MTSRSVLGSLPRLAVAMGVAAAIASSACGSEPGDEPACLDQAASLDCQALYGLHDRVIAPTFQELFDHLLSPTCAASGCHSGAHPQAGMGLDDIDGAYASLTATNAEGEQRVIPGNVTCGKLLVRLETAGESWSMPPRNHLKETALCPIRHWIANGAKR